VDEGGHLLSVRLPDGELLRFRPKLVVDRPYNRLASLLDGDGADVGQAGCPFQYTQPLRLVYHALGGDARRHVAQPRLSRVRSRGRVRFNHGWRRGARMWRSERRADGGLATHENSAQDAPLLADATGWELTLHDWRVFTIDAEGRLETMRDACGSHAELRSRCAAHFACQSFERRQVVFHGMLMDSSSASPIPRARDLHYGYDAAGHSAHLPRSRGDPATEPPTQSFTYRAGSHCSMIVSLSTTTTSKKKKTAKRGFGG
jgi:hypothetical protein